MRGATETAGCSSVAPPVRCQRPCAKMTRSGFQASMTLAAACNSFLCRQVKFSCKSRGSPPCGGDTPPIIVNKRRNTEPAVYGSQAAAASTL
jgi:hypothetical protein